MRVFVCGCVHGSWDIVVDEVNKLVENGTKLDLIIVAGDLEAFITESDLLSYKRPNGTQGFGSFHKIANGEKHLPCKMLVIGGNNESTDIIFQLPFGGWITPDVYFAGRASQIYFGDLLITCTSGVYNVKNYWKKVYEHFPVRKKECYSVNHTRAFSNFQVYGLTQLNIFVTHDWPSGIPKMFRDIIPKKSLVDSDDSNDFGMQDYRKILEKKQPKYWFAAHHHIKFECEPNPGTKFIAVPRVIQDNWYSLQTFDEKPGDFMISGEWINILKKTEEYMKDPSVLKDIDWDEEWTKINSLPSPDLPIKVPVMEYNNDYKVQTAKFCETYGIYNPNIM